MKLFVPFAGLLKISTWRERERDKSDRIQNPFFDLDLQLDKGQFRRIRS